MEVGIVGLPYVGKTTVFNALTRGNATVGTFSSSQSMNQAVVKVPDPRLARLNEIFMPRQTTEATIHYIDVAGLSRSRMEHGTMAPQLLSDLRQVDALCHVVRAFEDDNVPHVDVDINPPRDIENLNLELIFADLQVIENRLNRLGMELRTHKASALQTENAVLRKCRANLEEGIALRDLAWNNEEEKILRGFQFLTLKPLILVLNIGESQIAQQESIVAEIKPLLSTCELIPLCASLEMEIAQLDEGEAEAFLADMGLTEPALMRFIHASYRLLGLQTFFTGGPKEVRAWTIRRGATAVEAAAKIHTDLARGFIRAEVVAYDALDRCGSFAHAREAGEFRLEGKEYVVQDGDVMTIRFSVS